MFGSGGSARSRCGLGPGGATQGPGFLALRSGRDRALRPAAGRWSQYGEPAHPLARSARWSKLQSAIVMICCSEGRPARAGLFVVHDP
jgi:hypothetical protein